MNNTSEPTVFAYDIEEPIIIRGEKARKIANMMKERRVELDNLTEEQKKARRQEVASKFDALKRKKIEEWSL